VLHQSVSVQRASATHGEQRTRYFGCDFRLPRLGLAAFFPLGFPSFISSCGFGGIRTSAPIRRRVFSSTWGFPVMGKSKAIRANPFEPRPPILPNGDADPNVLLIQIGAVTTTWENTEIGYAYLFGFLAKPTGYAPAARRGYGAIISAKSRKDVIAGAAEVFFHLFPDQWLEQELADFLNIYISAASRRNDVAHGVIASGRSPRAGWYLEPNMYGNKRDVLLNTPYAYTSTQLKRLSKLFSGLRLDVEAFRRTLTRHYESSDPKRRARY